MANDFSAFHFTKAATIRTIGLALATLVLPSVALAQATPQSGLTTLGFSFERKSSTRLELEQANTNTLTIPTQPYAYQSESRGEPTRGKEYYQYIARQQQHQYAVLKVKNEAGKAITSVDWEFPYPRFQGDKEIVAYEVRNRLTISPGEVASLSQKLPQDGCGMQQIVTRGTYFIARSCGRKTRKTTGTYLQEARIKRVIFSDGTVWLAP